MVSSVPSKSIVSAPDVRANASRSGTLSIAMTRAAPSINALSDAELSYRAAAPDRDDVGGLDLAVVSGHPAGREDVAEKERLLVAHAVRDHDRRDVRIRDAYVFRLAAGVGSGKMRVAKQARGRIAKGLRRVVGRAVRAFTDRPVAFGHCSHSPQQIVNGTTTRS